MKVPIRYRFILSILISFTLSSASFGQNELTARQERKLNDFLKTLDDSTRTKVASNIDHILTGKYNENIKTLYDKATSLEQLLALVRLNQLDSVNKFNSQIKFLSQYLDNANYRTILDSIKITSWTNQSLENLKVQHLQELQIKTLKSSNDEMSKVISSLRIKLKEAKNNRIDSVEWSRRQDSLVRAFNTFKVENEDRVKDLASDYSNREVVFESKGLRSKRISFFAIILAIAVGLIFILRKIKERRILANAVFVKCRITNVKDKVLLADVLVDEKEQILQLRKFDAEPIRQAIGDTALIINNVFETANVSVKGKKLAIYRKGSPADADKFDQIYNNKISRLG